MICTSFRWAYYRTVRREPSGSTEVLAAYVSRDMITSFDDLSDLKGCERLHERGVEDEQELAHQANPGHRATISKGDG